MSHYSEMKMEKKLKNAWMTNLHFSRQPYVTELWKALSEPISKMHVFFKFNHLHFACFISHPHMHAQERFWHPWFVIWPHKFINFRWTILYYFLPKKTKKKNKNQRKQKLWWRIFFYFIFWENYTKTPKLKVIKRVHRLVGSYSLKFKVKWEKLGNWVHICVSFFFHLGKQMKEVGLTNERS